MTPEEVAAIREITDEITRLLEMADRRQSWAPIITALSHVAGIAWRLTENQQRHETWAAGEIERLKELYGYLPLWDGR